ncbi:peptidase S10 [Catenovulum sp. SM1970]|uniref:S10 family peptidase n=1 Tax=Marinifaba aquimaris TaxID=2741323 RepID=UPI001574DC92|nr:peptidase S10 [Marinifaba aquimaris]NTS78817.1 peptidase S10 [Marinifaba aquimaris]
MLKPSLFVLIFSILALPAMADTKPTPPVIPEAKSYQDEGKVKINGKTIKYQVLASDTHLKNEKGEVIANIFSTAYFKSDVKDLSKRPITFVFNGGPGSASVWLHLGIYGPKRIVVPSEAENAGASPYQLVDNPHSLLDQTDLVFVDPVGTGFSRAIGTGKNEDFWGVKQDADALAEFIRLFITKHKRWNSPKHLSGESYGTTRVGALVKSLQEGWTSVTLNGIHLISAILDFQMGDFTPGNDMPYVTFLPTYAATAWYHDALPANTKANYKNFEAFIDDVRAFASNEYLSLLFKGSRASEQEVNDTISKLHTFTGLDKGYLKQTQLRIDEFRFMKELLRDRGVVVGRLDSRYLADEFDDAGEKFEADPSGYGISGAYTAAINHYLFTELNVDKEDKYHVLNANVYLGWDWSNGKNARANGPTNVAPFVAKGMRQNKDMRVFVANGYYDLATPFYATEHSMNHYGIDPDRVTMKYYQAGHMMYVHKASLLALSEDLRAFYQQ